MKTKLIIVQSYVPNYRVSFFEGLRDKLAAHDIECLVAAGIPLTTQAKRGDSVDRDWIIPVNRRSVSLRGRTLRLSIEPAPWKMADALIMGLEGSSLPVYEALAYKSIRGFRLGLWGHAKPYVQRGNKIDLALESVQMKHADHIFVYTPGGAQYVGDQGVDPRKITTVMNTVDTSQLQMDIGSISKAEATAFIEKHKLDPHHTLCFIGGLDKSKRIEFLAQSLDVLWDLDPTVKLLVGGKGEDEHLLNQAYSRKQAIPLGYLDGPAKALVLNTSRAVCMPGRIGLVAVDALLAGRPVLTTEWPYHAPEVEYLTEGYSRLTSDNDAESFANLLWDYIKSPSTENHFLYPTMDSMISNYAKGVMDMLK